MTWRTVLRGGVLADGSSADVAIDSTGMIAVVGKVDPCDGDVTVDCGGMVVLASAVDPHAHLDKALSSRDVAAMPATLDEAVSSWLELSRRLPRADFVERATEAVETMVANGTTVIRTHVDVADGVELRAVDALIEVREQMASRGMADIQVVALAAPPLGGAAGRRHRYLLDAAVDAGVDVVGGSPDIDPDLAGATAAAVDVARRTGLPLDLHCDQSVDPSMLGVLDLTRMVVEHGLTRVTASHCISLSMQPVDRQQEIAAEMAAAGIAVTTMPLTSLFYFGWDQPVAPTRGLTAIQVLRDAGVVVAAGGDNVQDLFFPYGRFDPVETASVLAMAAHLSPAVAWDMCTTQGRLALGLPPVSVSPGSAADLVAIRGRSLPDALASASQERVVIRRGRVVSRSTVTRVTT